MRVHHIINDYSLKSGGAERLVRNLHLGLRSRGIESFLVGLQNHDDWDLNSALNFHCSSPYKIEAIKKLAKYLLEKVQSGDIIHYHLFPSSLYGALLKKILPKGTHLVTTEHSTSNRRRNKIWGRYLDFYIYSQYNYIIAISQGTQKALKEWQSKISNKIYTINNGAQLFFSTELKRYEKEELVILSVGSLRQAKNYSNALKAIALLEDHSFKYIIAGKGPLMESLKSLAVKLNINKRVEWLGHVNDVSKLYSIADIFLMPSEWEGFGLAGVEAMNASLPCIFSNIPGLGDLIDLEKKEGILVDPNKPEEITFYLSKLLYSRQLREELGGNAFKKSLIYGEEKMIDNYIDFYKKLING